MKLTREQRSHAAVFIAMAVLVGVGAFFGYLNSR